MCDYADLALYSHFPRNLFFCLTRIWLHILTFRVMPYVIYIFFKTQHIKRALPDNFNQDCPDKALFFLRLAQLILYLIVNLFHEFVQRKYGSIGFAVQSVGNSLAFLFLEAKYD